MALQRFEFLMSADEDESKFECWGVVMPDGSVAVKLKELAGFLGYEKVDKAYKHVPDEWKITWDKLDRRLVDTPTNWQSKTLFVIEPGVYALMARSNKPLAKWCMKFIYEVVVPAFRKNDPARWREGLKSHALHTAVSQFAPQEGHVYVATSPQYRDRRIYKIGRTASPADRLCALNTGRADDFLYFEHVSPDLGHEASVRVERLMHDSLAPLRMHGEFFQLTVDDDLTLVKRAIASFSAPASRRPRTRLDKDN
uniref:BRO-D n=1 Tax=Lymantria dispar multicapsid nuclear polyhedrosis virus TaxID=10449 RepID=A0A7S8FA76_NPVLD|nr:BRO-D [Lymantria dispar multiple nucleopolyhedrovirus]QPD02042.1 BRO-D [Lymantria dispar multiple nucleopolyhedrovirus]